MKFRRAKTLILMLVLLASLGIKAWPAMAAGGISVSQHYFPDANFLDYVRQFDTDRDGYLSFAEMDAVIEISCSAEGIASLTGIENFGKLENLDCQGNEIQNLDLSQNTELLELNCSHNPLTVLDLSSNTKLQKIDCMYTNLGSLNVSHLSDLTSLVCNNSYLTALDVSKNTKLQLLSCYDSHITSLDLSKNANLTVGEISETSSQTQLLSSWNGSMHEFKLSNIPGADKLANIEDVVQSGDHPGEMLPLPAGAVYDSDSGILKISPEKKIPQVIYVYNVKSPTLPGTKLIVRVNLLYADETQPPLRVAVFRTGSKASYTTGETVALAARAEGGKPPYRYQFFVIRSNGSTVILRRYAYSNTFNWVPVSPDAYKVGVKIQDAEGTVVGMDFDVLVTKPLEIAVFRTGHKSSYNVGETVALAARAEGGSTRYQYQFYIVRANGARVVLRNYASSNTFRWKPVTPDTYKVGVNVKDLDLGTLVNQEKTVTVAEPPTSELAVAVFRAGYKTEYSAGETVALAARGEGGRAPLQYQFYVYRSNGAKVILKNYNSVNIFNWKPLTPDTYRVCVAIRDASGKVVTGELNVKVK
ncbi:MAG: hypothetical protein QM296_00935 [Bacillota bacterium]|nr:hypothetical protein [Bacillota bacterium]